jgi:alkanesulfonate monooxygenase SsuD/methylene tetrahydromethanopterin reductase-like flavin-dependent oxidoreductase (luciferase family)
MGAYVLKSEASVEIGINIRHQNGADWDELVSAVTEAERLGFSSVVFPDHYVAVEHVVLPDGTRAEADVSSPTGPSDAWTVIAALVMRTERIRFGTMMTSSTFRLPGPLAVCVAQLNRFSGGRVDLGLGTNWLEHEHASFGIPYPPRAERFSRLAEQLALISTLWRTAEGQEFDFAGEFYQVKAGRGIPHRDGLRRPRIVIGGSGLVRTPRLAATYADEVNSLARTPAAAEPFMATCEEACAELGRDPATLRRSVLMPITCGDDDVEIERQLAAAGLRREQIDPDLIVTTKELVQRIERWQDAGIDRVVLSRRGAVDLPSLVLLGEEVVARFR